MPTDAKTAANAPAANANATANHATQSDADSSAKRSAANQASANQTAANQANAQHSTGPRTDDGKARSSQNALRHGLASGKLIIAGEDPAEFDAVHQELVESLVPANIAERMLLEQMAQQWWLMQRALRLQQEAFASAAPGTLPNQLALLIRYYSSAERSYHRALKSLLDMRKSAEQTVFRLMSVHKPSKMSAAFELDDDMAAEYKLYMETRDDVETLSQERLRDQERQAPSPVQPVRAA